MDHRTDAGEVVYEILSDVDSESEEPADVQPAENEQQNITPRADPLNANYGEPESEARSGWVMRKSQDLEER